MNTYMYRNGFRLLAATMLLSATDGAGVAAQTTAPAAPPSSAPTATTPATTLPPTPATPPTIPPAQATTPPVTAQPGAVTTQPTLQQPPLTPAPPLATPTTSAAPLSSTTSAPALSSAATGISMAQLDVNQDSFVEKSEIPVGSALTASRFALYDANSDGKLSPEELAKFVSELR